jgi:hypothetical protein
LESIALRAGRRIGAVEGRFPLFPIIPARKRRNRRDICAFARALVRIRNGGAPGGGDPAVRRPGEMS